MASLRDAESVNVDGLDCVINPPLNLLPLNLC